MNLNYFCHKSEKGKAFTETKGMWLTLEIITNCHMNITRLLVCNKFFDIVIIKDKVWIV